MRRLRRCVVTSALAVGLLSCQHARLGEDVRRDVRTLRELSLPQDARMIRRTEIEQHGRTARASWEFETDLSWEAYEPWVEVRLMHEATFHKRPSAVGSLEFVLQLPGDVYHVLIERTRDVPLRVRVTFEGAAS